MSTESIINGIVAKRNALNYEETKENREAVDKIMALEARIKSLAPRISEMYEVAKALTENRFWMGGRSRYGQAAPEFLTDHIDHRVGFFAKHPYFDAPGRDFTLTGYFGIANGGACGSNDLKIDLEGNVERWDLTAWGNYKDNRIRYYKNLARLVERFDEYEAAFYEYAKNPIPRSREL